MSFDNRKKELAKNTLILTIGRVCTQGVNFFLLPLYTSILAPEEYGIVDLFNTYIMLLIPLVNWQFDLGLFRFMLEDRNNYNRHKSLLSTVLNTNILQCTAYLILYFFAQNYISSPYKIFLAVDVVINVIFNTLLQFTRGLGHNGSYSFASFISAGLMVVLNVIFILFMGLGSLGLFLATVCSKLLAVFYLIFSQHIWDYYNIKLYDKKIFIDLKKYSLPLVPTQLSWWVLNASDRSIITRFLGIAINGIYSVANKFSGIYITFYNIFSMAWTELFATHINDDDKDVFFTEMLNTIFPLFSSIVFFIIAVMPWLFPILIDDKYASGYNHVYILMLATLSQVVCGLYSVVYLAVKKTNESAKTAFIAAIINIAVHLILIKYINLYAASISSYVSYTVMAIYRYFDSQKYVKMIFKPTLFFSSIFICLFSIFSLILNNKYMYILNVVVVTIYTLLANKKFISGSFKVLKTTLQK